MGKPAPACDLFLYEEVRPLKAVVFVKQTPDSAATMSVKDGKADWGDAPLIVNPWDEYAVEEAIRLKENLNGSAVALLMGGESGKEALKTCLAMGCDEAILLSDALMQGSDALGTARVLAAAVGKQGDVDVAIFGKQAIDGDTGFVPMAVARLLGWSPLSYVFKIVAIDPAAKTITVERLLEEGKQIVTASLPAVISVVKDINEPRYPSFMGIRKASKATIPVWTAADLGLGAGEIGAEAAKVVWGEVRPLPVRTGAVEMITGNSPEEIANTLLDKLIAEKVL